MVLLSPSLGLASIDWDFGSDVMISGALALVLTYCFVSGSESDEDIVNIGIVKV